MKHVRSIIESLIIGLTIASVFWSMAWCTVNQGG